MSKALSTTQEGMLYRVAVKELKLRYQNGYLYIYICIDM